MSFAVYGIRGQLPGVVSPKTFLSRIYYSGIRLKEEEFDDMVAKYKKHCDAHNLLTQDIVAEVKYLAGHNAALTSLCLKIITKDLAKLSKFEKPCEREVKAFISSGKLDSHLVSQGCRAFRPFEELEPSLPESKDVFLKMLNHLIKEGQHPIEDPITKIEATQMIKLGICAVRNDGLNEYIEFTCPLTAIYYQK